jgi:hypothetical protein
MGYPFRSRRLRFRRCASPHNKVLQRTLDPDAALRPQAVVRLKRRGAPSLDPSLQFERMNAITLAALRAFPQQLEEHYAAFPAEFKNWAPPSWEGVPSEPLTAIEQVCHLRDIETDGYHVRLHRTLTEVHPTFVSIDTEALAKERAYGKSDATAALAAFRLARRQTVALIDGLAPEQFDRTAVFEGYGPLSLRSLVHYLCSHDQQHLAGLQWLLGKLEAFRVPAQV